MRESEGDRGILGSWDERDERTRSAKRKRPLGMDQAFLVCVCVCVSTRVFLFLEVVEPRARE